MKCPLTGSSIRFFLPGCAVLLGAAALLCWPVQAAQAVREGLALCGSVIFPSLFPFFVLSSLVVELGLSRLLGKLLQGAMRPLFRVNGACASAVVLGLVGGYPVGARTAAALYKSGQCSRDEARRLLAFCNNSGPAFILGVVGIGIFGSTRTGLLLYAVHLGAALLVGLVFRFYAPYRPDETSQPEPQFHSVSAGAAFTRAVTGALTGLLSVSAFVICFTVILQLLSLGGILGLADALLSRILSLLELDPSLSAGLAAGLLELSSGITALGTGDPTHRLYAAAFLLGWGGLSVHCQTMAALENSGLPTGTYWTGKLLHGALSALLLRLLLPSLRSYLPVGSCVVQPTSGGSTPDLILYFLYALAPCLLAWLAFAALYAAGRKKSGGKIHRQGV